MSGFSLALALSLAATPALQAPALVPFPLGQAVLIIFGAKAEPACAEQLRRLSYGERGLVSRNTVVWHVDGEEVTPLLGASHACGSDMLRHHFGIFDQAFAALLIDKHGELILRRRQPVTASELFSRLDGLTAPPVDIAA